MAYPETKDDTVLYDKKNLYGDKDITVKMLDGSILDIWGGVYINGNPIANVANVPVATQAEAEAGVRNDVLMTPLRTQDKMNTYDFIEVGPSPPADQDWLWADTTDSGVVYGMPPATDYETQIGVATNKAVTPASLKSTLPIVDARQIGAKCDNSTDDSAALQAAINAGITVCIRGTARITTPLILSTYSGNIVGIGMHGYSGTRSRIVQATDGQPAIIINASRGSFIRDIAIEHVTASTNVGSIGIRLDGLVGQFDASCVYLRNNGIGIGINQSGAGPNAIFASTFSNIRIDAYGVSALDLRAVGGGGTGCVFDTVYTNAGGISVAPVAAPVRIYQHHDFCFSGLHVEGVKASNGIEINNCYGLRLQSVHCEAFAATLSGGSVIKIIGGTNTSMYVGTVDVFNSVFDVANGPAAYSIIGVDSATSAVTISIDTIDVHTATVTGCTLQPLQLLSNSIGSVRQSYMSAGTNQPGIGASARCEFFNGMRDKITLGAFTSFTLRNDYMVAAAAPSSGTYQVGDVVFGTVPVAGGTIGWVCVTAGSPGTWKTWGSISP